MRGREVASTDPDDETPTATGIPAPFPLPTRSPSAAGGHLGIVETWVENHGADVNYQFQSQTPLNQASHARAALVARIVRLRERG